MKQPKIVQTLLIGLFVLAAAPVAAATASPADAPACTPASATAPAQTDGAQQPVVETSGGIGAASTCTADCWDGSSVTCDEGPSCSAQDSDCNSGIRGYCEDGSGRTYCPICPSSGCTAATFCSGGPGSSIECSGDNYCNQAFGCWVYCDGVTTWCPDADKSSCPLVN